MASTRNINDPENYKLEQYSLMKERNYMPFKSYACPTETMFAGDGLIQGNLRNTQLANNAVDVESFLYGINTSNLVNPIAPVVADIKQLKSLSIIDRIPIIMPKPLVTEPGQRLRLFE
jgi:hypothetical protein